MAGKTHLAVLSVILSGLGSVLPAVARDLTFEERVKAQEAIERVYYAHQIGATKPFGEAVPRDVLEQKVRTYLKQSAALEKYWSTPVTAEMLRRETERVTSQTRLPERLEQLYTALGRDSVLFQETVARAALVGRLARSFFVQDARLRGGIDRKGGADASEDADWDRWWPRISDQLDETSVRAVAATIDLPQPSRARSRQTFDPSSFAAGGAAGNDGAVCSAPDTWENGALDHPTPKPRLGASVVWTGSLMLVWGGADFIELPPSNTFVENDGARYDPATDTWSPISGLGAPGQRVEQAAVWSGTELIVWGGQGSPACSGGCFNNCEYGDGGRYDPVSDSWRSMSTLNAPSPRHDLTAVWIGSSMIVWGGIRQVFTINPRTGQCSSNWAYYADGRRYDPVSDTWTTISTTGAPSARAEHAAVWTGDTMIVWGGHETLASFQTGGRYSPATDTWLPTSTLGAPSARTDGFSVIWTGTEMIVWGGDGPAGSALATGGRYAPSTDSWTGVSSAAAPAGRRFHSSAWTGSQMLVWGGSDASSDLGDGGRYDPVLDSWSAIASAGAPPPRSHHGAVWTGQRMIVWGGNPLQGGRYDPATDTWTPTQSAFTPFARHGHQSIWTGNLLVVHGGEAGVFGELPGIKGARYDPLLETWTPTSTVNDPSNYFESAMIWTGQQVIVWGGLRSSGPFFSASGGRYDPIADTWQPTSSVGAPTARGYMTDVWTGHVMVIWGGRDSVTSFTNTGGRYDPGTDTWSPTTTIGAPSARFGHTAVWTGTRMIVWGGVDNTSDTNTGGVYDPASDHWVDTTTLTNAPSGRDSHTAVWTGSRMIVWGGDQGPSSGLTSTGGSFNPSSNTWQALSLQGAPSPRDGHSAIWTGQAMLIWGGENFFPGLSYFGDGSRYDPASDSWSPMASAGAPQPRGVHSASMIGDSMIVWGGSSSQDGSDLQSGGRYCVCSATLYHADLDGDGRGDPGAAESACAAPPGYVSDGSDCDDTSALIWSKPSEVQSLTLVDGATVQWSVPSQPGGASPVYDVVRSSNKVDFVIGATCVAAGQTTASAVDPEAPSIGAAFYYLVAARTGCADGQGPWGADSQGQPIQVRTCP